MSWSHETSPAPQTPHPRAVAGHPSAFTKIKFPINESWNWEMSSRIPGSECVAAKVFSELQVGCVGGSMWVTVVWPVRSMAEGDLWPPFAGVESREI